MTRTRTTRPAFTLMEILMSILVIFLLMGMLIVGLRYARRSAHGARDTATVTSLKQGVDKFKAEFGFSPPLVKDFDQTNPPVRVVSGRNVPYIYRVSDTTNNDAATLRRNNPAPTAADAWLDLRFSTSSLPYYVIGALEVTTDPAGNGAPIDGVPGVGFMTPKRDGTFEKAGRRFDPFFDLGKSAKALFSVNVAEGRIELRDANNVAVRYYRWLQGNPTINNRVAAPEDTNVPYLLYRDPRIPPAAPQPYAETVPAHLQGAEFAIVAAGPNGVFGDEPELFASSVPAVKALGMDWSAMAHKVGLNDDGTGPTRDKIRYEAMKDNVVEAGK